MYEVCSESVLCLVQSTDVTLHHRRNAIHRPKQIERKYS